MELILDILMLFILMGCVFKLSLWKFWQRLIYSAVLGAFTWWSVRYAVLQSKTQLADYLQNTSALQNMAVLVTIESAVGLAFGLFYLGDSRPKLVRRFRFSRLLWWYPSLLMFPVAFYLLTQAIFASVGVSFQTMAGLISAAVTLLLPLLSEGVKRLLPDADGRVEIHLLSLVFVCILGLLSTQNGRMVYAVKETPIDWQSLALTFALFLLPAIAGLLLNKAKWRLRHKYES